MLLDGLGDHQATEAPLPGCVWAYLAAYRGQEKSAEIIETTISLAEQRDEDSTSTPLLGGDPASVEPVPDARRSLLRWATCDVGVQTHILNELVEAAARAVSTPLRRTLQTSCSSKPRCAVPTQPRHGRRAIAGQ